ncbi:hypothetical protein VSH64_26755 [Amycolatopsis rhabdoformis]|uniref:Uncharacterized protein n=1 Tax=Amycolatopsis rhabdoformis TaxID=1448059 RepID=A0ABZ1HWZ5_9PSEU|nr:hypothetical protein [Amycolatopsis rhabdoformis]WSE26480.1 hypothetical protein VSH64_26755 [Amycolatopsis rhabdoformis]
MWAPVTVALLIGFFGNLSLDRVGTGVVFLILAVAVVVTTAVLHREKTAA